MGLFETRKRPAAGVLFAGSAGFAVPLAQLLSNRGFLVRIVSQTPPHHMPGFLRTEGALIRDDETNPAALEHAGIATVQVVVAATDSDNRNLLIGQYAREVSGVPKVIALLNDPEREAVYREFGIAAFNPDILCSAEIARQWFPQAKGEP